MRILGKQTKLAKLPEVAAQGNLHQVVDETTDVKQQFIKPVLSDYVKFYRIAYMQARQTFINAIKDVADPGSGYTSGVDIGDQISSVLKKGKGAEITKGMRVTKADGGFNVSLPVITTTINNTLRTNLGISEWSDIGKYKAGISKVIDYFGKDILDLTKSISKVIPITVSYSRDDLIEMGNSTKESTVAAAKANIKTMRLLIGPASTVAEIILIIDNKRTRFSNIDQVPNDFKAAYGEKISYERDIHIFVDLFIPDEVAKYATQTSSVDDISLRDISQWATTQSTTRLEKVGNKVEVIRSIESISKSNKGLKGKVKTNKHGLTVSVAGQIMYIPDIDETNTYNKDRDELSIVTRFGDEEYVVNDKIIPKRVLGDPEVEPELDEFGKKIVAVGPQTKNRIIYTDWINRKLSYSNTAGKLNVLDLEGYVPADATKVLTILNMSIAKPSDVARNLINGLAKMLQDTLGVGDPVSETDLDQFRSVDGVSIWMVRAVSTDFKSYSLVPLFKHIPGLLTEMAKTDKLPEDIEEFVDPAAVTFALISPTSPILFLRSLYKSLKRALDEVMKDIPKYLSTRSVLNGMTGIGVLVTIVKYAPRYEEVFALDREMRKNYVDPDIEENYVPKGIPFVKDFAYMPHQAKADNRLKNGSKRIVLDAQAGAGKTILILNHILRMLGEGKIKKPIIACPSHLVKDYVKESVFLTKGKLNVIPLNTNIMNTRGDDALAELIRGAPINTVLVTSFDFIAHKVKQIPYGSEEVDVGLNNEFLRQFDFDLIAIDESHYLKNDSKRSRMVQKLTSDIEYILEATGTFVANQLTDVVGQFRIMDPTVFGDEKKFFDDYASEVNGSTVFAWKPNAEKNIMGKISQNSDHIVSKRKEWAALLPDATHKFHTVNMTDSQQKVYNSILNKTLEELRNDPKFTKQLSDNVDTDLEGLLMPYLVNLERFLSAPGLDKAGAELLTGDDLISPKISKIVEIVEKHLSSRTPGKILIFSSYVRTAQSVYDALPPAIQNITVNYSASSKDADIIKFKSSKYEVLVGVEKSLNTGINFQFVSRIIRSESIWTPGDLEQGEARVNRPDPKNKDSLRDRSEIFLDWILVDQSIDITKTARLISKTISKTRFDMQDFRAYDNIEDLPIIGMSLANLENYNTLDTGSETDLLHYLETYSDIKAIEFDEFEDFRNDPNNSTVAVAVEDGGILKGSAVLKNIPYITDQGLPFADDLGIEQLNSYMEENPGIEVKDLRVHTEFGDGVITRESKKSIAVKLDSGIKITTEKLKAYIITDGSKVSVFDRMSKFIGLPIKGVVTIKQEEPIDTNPNVSEPPKQSKVKRPVPNVDKDANGTINIYLSVINNSPALVIDDSDPDIDVRSLKKFGFVWVGNYMFAHIKTAKAMREVLDKIFLSFDVHSGFQRILEKVYNSFSVGKKRLLNVDQVNQAQAKNFLISRKRNTPKGSLKPYTVLQDGELYLIVDMERQPSAAQVRSKVRVPSITWKVDGEQWMFIGKSKTDLKDKIQEMQDTGYIIGNMDGIKKQYNELKIIKKG